MPSKAEAELCGRCNCSSADSGMHGIDGHAHADSNNVELPALSTAASTTVALRTRFLLALTSLLLRGRSVENNANGTPFLLVPSEQVREELSADSRWESVRLVDRVDCEVEACEVKVELDAVGSFSPHQLVPLSLHSAAHSSVAFFFAFVPIFLCQNSGQIWGGRPVPSWRLAFRPPSSGRSRLLLL